MTGEEMERAIQILIQHHANVSTDIEGLKEAQEKTVANIDSLTGIVVDLAQSVVRLESLADIDRQETRDAINKLILGNEVTRSLAQDVARLAIATSVNGSIPLRRSLGKRSLHFRHCDFEALLDSKQRR